jgi:hypothetical protein
MKTALLAAVVIAAFTVGCSADGAARNDWYRHSLANIHFDNHSGWLGMGQSIDDLAKLLGTVPVTMLQVSAQSDGPATYPTKVTYINPDVNYDTVGTFKTITKRLGMKLCIYMSTDRRPQLIKQHPEWAYVDAQGKPDPIVVCERPNKKKKGYLYEAHLPQIREIIAKYDPDGFWFDGDYWYSRPCWCPRCLAEWKAETGTDAPRDASSPLWRKWTDWNQARYEEYRKIVGEAIHAASPKALYTSNWSWAWTPEPIADCADTLSGDAWNIKSIQYTTMRWGAQEKTPWDMMSFTAAYRMAGREESLQRCLQEAGLTIAAGGNWFIWGFSGGEVPPFGVEMARHCAQFVRDREKALGPSVSLSQVAVLDSETSFYRGQTDPGADSRVGNIARNLQESHYLTDIVNEETWRGHELRYRVVVIPEHRWLAPVTVAALKRFAEGGGTVLLSGAAMRGDDGTPESDEVKSLAGISRAGASTAGPCALELGGDTQMLSNAWKVQAAGAETLAQFTNGDSALTRNALGKGAVAYLATSDFRYPDDGALARVLRRLGVGPSYTVSGNGTTPLVCSLRGKPGATVLHVTDLSTHSNGALVDLDSTGFTELSAILQGVEVSFPAAKAPTGVYAVPTATPAAVRYANGIVTVHFNQMQTHAAAILTGIDGSSGFMPADTPPPSATPHPEDLTTGVIFADDFSQAAVGQPPARPWASEMKDTTPIAVVADAGAPGGKRAVRLTDAPGSSFWPFLHRSFPAFRRGKARLSCDLRVDPGVECLIEMRYEGKGAGPAITFGGDGNIVASGRKLTNVPPGTWFHVDVTFQVGGVKPGYEVAITVPGQPTQTFAGIPHATEWFYRCDSFYLVGPAEKPGNFYLANVSLERLSAK